jgi:hypothetical protein
VENHRIGAENVYEVTMADIHFIRETSDYEKLLADIEAIIK